MSRNETLKLIALFAAVILIGCLMAVCLIHYGNSLAPSGNLSSEDRYADRVPGLSIISHQKEIIPENGTLVVRKMEQMAEDNLQNLLATIDTGNIRDCRRYGTVALMQYSTPIELTWIDRGGEEPVSHIIDAHKIIITIPDGTDRPFGPENLNYRVLVYGSGNPEVKVLGLPVSQANELLELIGLAPIEKKR